MLTAARDGADLSEEDIQNEVETFMFEVGFFSFTSKE